MRGTKLIPPLPIKDRIQDSLGASEYHLIRQQKRDGGKSDTEISLPSLLYILNALEKYLDLNLGWGLRDKSSYKQNISQQVMTL